MSGSGELELKCGGGAERRSRCINVGHPRQVNEKAILGSVRECGGTLVLLEGLRDAEEIHPAVNNALERSECVRALARRGLTHIGLVHELGAAGVVEPEHETIRT